MKSRIPLSVCFIAMMTAPIAARAFADDSSAPAADATTQPEVHRAGGGFRGGAFAGGGFSGGGNFTGVTGAGGNVGVVTANDGHGNVTTVRYMPGDRAAIISTEAMDAQTQSRLKEDLGIMQKLLRDQIRQLTDDAAPNAMGIRLTMLTETMPMYIEGCGAIFSDSVSLPLASADANASKPDEKGSTTTSAWDRAKNELNGNDRPASPLRSGGFRILALPPSQKFDQAKLDELVNGLIKTLPEASHMRGLKPDEAVIVTIAGADDSGNPVRLTIKAKKSDIDDAAAGKIKPEEFAQRVTHRIG